MARFHVIKQSMERRTVASGAFLNAAPCEQKEGLVRKVTMTLTAAVLLLGTMALQASAQNQQRGAASIHALRNATPIVTPAACYGGTGY